MTKPGRAVFLLGSRRINTRIGMFARSIIRDGFAIDLFALPRGAWMAPSIDGEFPLQAKSGFRARIAADRIGALRAVVCFHWLMLPLGLLIARWRRIPLVYDEHDHYELNTLEGGGGNLLRRAVGVAIRVVHRLCLPRVDLVTCIHLKDSVLRNRLLAWNRNVLELGNYPDERWRTALPRPNGGAVHFLYAGGVFVEKGLDAVLQAYSRVAAGLPGSCRLDVFGAGDPDLVRRLQEVDGVCMHGEVSALVLRRFVANHRCCGLAVLARTPRYDLVGTNLTKLYEYLALGMPVIVSDSGEVGAWVNSARVGVVVPGAQDIDAIATAMRRLVEEVNLYNDCAGQAAALMERPELRWDHEWMRVRETGLLGAGQTELRDIR